MKYITTSWDDGHPLDFKIAELLDKYNLQGTFYIPRKNEEHEVMPEKEIITLSQQFEIGGHTLNHVRLKKNMEHVYQFEISGSFQWLKGLLNLEPVSFCFPGGVYDEKVIEFVKNAGYKFYRSTELLTSQIEISGGLLTTTLQIYEHKKFTYLKHLLKRRRVNDFIRLLLTNTNTELQYLADMFLDKIEKENSGCFHIWGHSWEIDEFGLWHKLENLLRHLSGRDGFKYIQNKDLEALIRT